MNKPCPQAMKVRLKPELNSLKLGACRTYVSRLDFCPFSPGASLLLAPGEPPSFAFVALHGGFSSLSLSALFGSRVYDSPPLLRRCQNTHVTQLRLSFCRLASGKNHQKSPRSLKVRQTPSIHNGTTPSLSFLFC